MGNISNQLKENITPNRVYFLKSSNCRKVFDLKRSLNDKFIDSDTPVLKTKKPIIQSIISKEVKAKFSRTPLKR
jgi:hypothetical protein